MGIGSDEDGFCDGSVEVFDVVDAELVDALVEADRSKWGGADVVFVEEDFRTPWGDGDGEISFADLDVLAKGFAFFDLNAKRQVYVGFGAPQDQIVRAFVEGDRVGLARDGVGLFADVEFAGARPRGGEQERSVACGWCCFGRGRIGFGDGAGFADLDLWIRRGRYIGRYIGLCDRRGCTSVRGFGRWGNGRCVADGLSGWMDASCWDGRAGSGSGVGSLGLDGRGSGRDGALCAQTPEDEDQADQEDDQKR